MSCDGFEHGTRVTTLVNFEHLGTYLAKDIVGTVEDVDRLNHRIDVRFDELGLVMGLPAHSFGSVATAS